MAELLLTERVGQDGNIALLTMNRPEVRNAMNPELRVAISDALRQAEADPEVRVVILTGAGPAGGGTTLAQRIPLAVALELGLTGDPIPARRAAELGLINAVVPADQVLAAAIGLADRIAPNAPLALSLTKRLIRERRWGTAEETDSVFGSADAREGAVAFAEKRAPAWTGA
jgi:enoyl-CoA hydratase/carnithine racemase